MESEILQILYWISQYGYVALPFLFVALGPIVGFVCGMLVSWGTLSFVPVFVLYVASMFGRDVGLYHIGRVGGDFIQSFWLGRKVLSFVEYCLSLGIPRFADASPWRFFWTLLLAKGMPLLSVAVVASLGVQELPKDRVFSVLVLIQTMWSAVIVALGYFWGGVVKDAEGLFFSLGLMLFGVVVVALCYQYLRQRITRSDGSMKLFFSGLKPT